MRKFVQEFKKFITKGNVVDMAVAVIIGTAFNKIVSSLVADIITPLISLATGNVDFTELSLILRPENGDIPALTLNYGKFLQYIIDFLIIAASIFAMTKVLSKLERKKPEPKKEEKIVKKEEVVLLEEIRDLLKTTKKDK